MKNLKIIKCQLINAIMQLYDNKTAEIKQGEILKNKTEGR